jgi:hypothetical protein
MIHWMDEHHGTYLEMGLMSIKEKILAHLCQFFVNLAI